MSIQKREKQPSKELLLLIRQSTKALVDFAEVWKKVQEKGYSEGFDEEELREMVRPALKQKLTTGQIKYLFDPIYYIEKSKLQRKENKFDIFAKVNGFSYEGPIEYMIELLEGLEKSGKIKDKKFDVLTQVSTRGVPPEKLPEMIRQLNDDHKSATEEEIKKIKLASPQLHFDEKAMREFLDK